MLLNPERSTNINNNMNLESLKTEPRLLLEAKLNPLAGTRFQPTGFPDLGAAQYKLPDGTDMLLVESAQSMANRLEIVCWNTTANDWVTSLAGLPCVVVNDSKDAPLTNSVLEAHRLNSPYIVNTKWFQDFVRAVGFEDGKPFDRQKLVAALLKYDINSLVHGIFLEKIAGVIRLPRSLTAFIEAKNITVAASGGVKNDRVRATKGAEGQTAKEGFGNVPFHREEFCGEITAYFTLDLALIRGFGLGAAVEQLLTALALFKIQRFLRDGLRLRTACDLELQGTVQVKRPTGFTLPALKEIEDALPELIKAAAGGFAQPPQTTVKFED